MAGGRGRHRDLSMNRVRTAREVVDGLRAVLVGRENAGIRVDALLHYGAVDISPSNLVVWILLAGRSDDQLPEWTVITDTMSPETIASGWLSGLRTEIVARFACAQWPDPEQILVLADSAHRVETQGGWSYFK